ncbi:hypothetical protein LXL04_026277 [Taraxacum kok-saghyz]
MSVFYFTGDALSWYKHLSTNHLLGTWAEFTRALEIRFGPSTYENHRASLFKLRQTSSVAAYQSEFEKISNCVEDLPVPALRDCFVSGLRPEIQAEVALHNPSTLHDTYGLARLVVDKLASNRSRFSPTSRTFYHGISSNSKPTNSPATNSPLPGLLPTPSTPTKTTLPFTRLSAEALQKRKAEGLCFRCPEFFSPDHVCKPPQFLLIVDNDEHLDTTNIEEPQSPTTDNLLPFNTDDYPNNPSNPPHFLSLSDAAFFGLHSHRALRVTGHINGQPVTTLIDCGSTHNIIQPRIANLLNLTPTPITPFPVMIGNGQHLECNGFFPTLPLQLNYVTFQVPLFVLLVEGTDIILGLAWLSSLGPLMADVSIPQLSFTIQNQTYVLRGEPLNGPISPSSLHTLIHKQSVASLHTLLFHHQTDIEPATTPIPHPDSQIKSLLL